MSIATPLSSDQRAAELIGAVLDDRIHNLTAERVELLTASARIIEIDADLAILLGEKAKIAPRRPPKAAFDVPIADLQTSKVDSANANSTR